MQNNKKIIKYITKILQKLFRVIYFYFHAKVTFQNLGLFLEDHFFVISLLFSSSKKRL